VGVGEIDKGEIAKVPFIITFSKSSFHGEFDRAKLEDPSMGRDVNVLLVIAESLIYTAVADSTVRTDHSESIETVNTLADKTITG